MHLFESLKTSATGPVLLYAGTGVEVLVLPTKRLHAMYKFQRDDIVLSVNSRNWIIQPYIPVT
jgi:hypothetical protein